MREGAPRQSKPEINVFVSTTTFILQPSLDTSRIDLGFDLFIARLLARQIAKLVDTRPSLFRFTPFQLFAHQHLDRCRLEQALFAGLIGDFVRK